MIKALVKEFRNDETLQGELNAFLTRWQTKHGETLPIVFITTHAPQTQKSLSEPEMVLSPDHVNYTFFYREAE